MTDDEANKIADAIAGAVAYNPRARETLQNLIDELNAAGLGYVFGVDVDAPAFPGAMAVQSSAYRPTVSVIAGGAEQAVQLAAAEAAIRELVRDVVAPANTRIAVLEAQLENVRLLAASMAEHMGAAVESLRRGLGDPDLGGDGK